MTLWFARLMIDISTMLPCSAARLPRSAMAATASSASNPDLRMQPCSGCKMPTPEMPAPLPWASTRAAALSMENGGPNMVKVLPAPVWP